MANLDVYLGDYTATYIAAAGPNNVILASDGYLHAIIIGLDVAGGIVEVSDHISDGDGAVRIYLEDPPVGVYPINARFTSGITANMTLQTNVTFIWRK